MKIGELFAGYGGLGMGVQAVLGGEIAWFSEFDAAPSKILAHRFPGVPNHGDITKIDWTQVEPVDILTRGFPCQDVSLAGARAGIKDGTRSGLWSEFARAIEALQPEMVVIENVRGLLSASAGGSVEPDPWGVGDGATRPVLNALGAVLGDLVRLGYDTRRCGLRAADAGAPHGRFRLFIVAYRVGERRGEGRTESAGSEGRLEAVVRGLVSDANHPGRREHWGSISVRQEQPAAEHVGHDALADTSSARFGKHPGEPSPQEAGPRSGDQLASSGQPRADTDWGPYRQAIERWELITGRFAPNPTRKDGRNEGDRLSPEFVEWMMGLPAGHLTDPAIGISRNEQLKALGNGVVWQQAALALSVLLGGLSHSNQTTEGV